jgi:hypothetical protein
MKLETIQLKAQVGKLLKTFKGKIAPTTYAKYQRKITASERKDILNKIKLELETNFITSQQERIAKEKQKKALKAKPKERPPAQTSIHQLIINKEMVSRQNPYTIQTHQIQLKRMMKQNPNQLYRQTVDYFNGKGELITDTFINYTSKKYEWDWDTIERKITTISDEMYQVYNRFQWIGTKANLTKNEKERIIFNMSSGEYTDWKIEHFLDNMTDEDGINDPNAYAIINTYAYDQTNYKKMVKHFNYDSQIMQDDNNTGTCLYDAVLKFFESSNDKNKKKYFNKLTREKETYCKAYKIDEIENLAKLCNSSIKITNLITGDNYIYIIIFNNNALLSFIE